MNNNANQNVNSSQPNKKSKAPIIIIISVAVIIALIVFHLLLNFVVNPSIEMVNRGLIHIENYDILVEREVSWDELEEQPDYSSSWDWFDNVNSYSVKKLKNFMKENDLVIVPGSYTLWDTISYENMLATLDFREVPDDDSTDSVFDFIDSLE